MIERVFLRAALLGFDLDFRLECVRAACGDTRCRALSVILTHVFSLSTSGARFRRQWQSSLSDPVSHRGTRSLAMATSTAPSLSVGYARRGGGSRTTFLKLSAGGKIAIGDRVARRLARVCRDSGYRALTRCRALMFLTPFILYHHPFDVGCDGGYPPLGVPD